MTTFVRGALAYLVATFPLAFIWHLVLFEGIYDELGVFRDEPNVALGLAAIVVQGLLLSYAFPRVYRGGSVVRAGVKVGLLAGMFLWSSQVVAAAAKQEVSSLATWLGIETAYFLLQFTLVGLALAWAHRAALEEA